MSQVVFCVVPHVVTPSFVELSSTGAHQPTWLGPNPIAKRVVDKKREITRMAHEIYPEGAVVATNLHSLNPTAVHTPWNGWPKFCRLKRFQDRISKFQPFIFQVQRLKLSGRVEANKHLGNHGKRISSSACFCCPFWRVVFCYKRFTYKTWVVYRNSWIKQRGNVWSNCPGCSRKSWVSFSWIMTPGKW